MIELLVILILLLVNGLFAMYEIALVSSRRSRLEEMSIAGNKGAKVALHLLKEPEVILSAIQVGITLVGIVSGAYGGVALSEDVAPLFERIGFLAEYSQALSFASIVALITYLSLVIGELVPKTLALNNPEKISVFLSPVMRQVGLILYPIVWFLSISTKLFMVIFRIRKREGTMITENELRLLLKQGSEHGVIEKEESEIINEVIRFGDKRAGSIMTHRVNVVWLDARESTDDLIMKARGSVHSRLPVCNGKIDEVTGVVRVRDLLDNYLKNNAVDWDEILFEPLYIPEQVPALKVMEMFRKTKNHFGIVINEYGSMEGILTLHDLAEHILGDFPAQDDTGEPEVFRREDGSYLIDGTARIEDLNDLLGTHSLFSGEEESYGVQTLGGLAMLHLNRIPTAGDRFVIQDFTFEIVDMDGNRVDKVLIQENKEK